MNFTRATLFVFASLLIPVFAQAAPLCPALTGASGAYYGGIAAAGTNCNTIVTINANGTLTFTYPNGNPYDGNDDNYVGVVNNYSAGIASLTITGSGIFGFDGDGIDAYGIAGNSIDTNQYGAAAYGGTDAYFTNVSGNANVGTVNFIGGIAVGGTGYFSLENAPASGSPLTGTITATTTPEPSSLILLATGTLGVVGSVRRRLASRAAVSRV